LFNFGSGNHSKVNDPPNLDLVSIKEGKIKKGGVSGPPTTHPPPPPKGQGGKQEPIVVNIETAKKLFAEPEEIDELKEEIRTLRLYIAHLQDAVMGIAPVSYGCPPMILQVAEDRRDLKEKDNE